MEHLHDDVIRKVDDGDVRFIRLWFCDIAGTLKSIAISPSDLEVAFTEGIGIDGSTIERSEERRVGKEWRARWSREAQKRKHRAIGPTQHGNEQQIMGNSRG